MCKGSICINLDALTLEEFVQNKRKWKINAEKKSGEEGA